jgi:hypothetical protein
MDRFINQVAVKLKAINRAGAFHEDTALALFALIRQHLEASALKTRYKTTAFYCDWCLHVKLDRSQSVKEFLQQIDDVISDDKEPSLNDKINEIISIQRLRNELVQIADSAGVNSNAFSSRAGWKAFLQVLLTSLIDKPIVRAKGKQATAKRLAAQFVLEIPDLSDVDKEYLDEFAISQGAVFWKIRVLPIGYDLTGPLVVTESPESFERP